MLLTINIGNSSTALGIFENKKLVKKYRLSTHPIGTADELRIKINTLLNFEKISLSDFTSIVACSVIPQVTQVLTTAFERTPLRFFDYKSPFSFEIKVPEPHKVGDDRLVTAEAAMREHGTPVIIVDAGTATTINAVSRKNEFLGGAITIGIDLSMQALAQNTALLPTLTLQAPEKAIATNTIEALRSGLVLGHACLIDGMIQKFKQELSEPNVKVILTGGKSSLLKSLCSEITHTDPDLTLKGLHYLYETYQSR